MFKRLVLILFLFLPYQFAVADIASDLADGLTVDQAVQNAFDAGETSEAIAAALQAAGVTAEDAAAALINAGVPFGDAISATAKTYGVESAGLAASLAPGGRGPAGGTGTGSTGVGGGGGGGGGGESVSPS